MKWNGMIWSQCRQRAHLGGNFHHRPTPSRRRIPQSVHEDQGSLDFSTFRRADLNAPTGLVHVGHGLVGSREELFTHRGKRKTHESQTSGRWGWSDQRHKSLPIGTGNLVVYYATIAPRLGGRLLILLSISTKLTKYYRIIFIYDILLTYILLIIFLYTV